MPAETAFDFAAALRQVDGDADLLALLADLFRTQAAADIASIRAALERGDHREVTQRAHRLKGSAIQFHAAPLRTAAGRLEELAGRKDAHEAAALVPVLEQAIQKLVHAIRKALEAR